jgi:hypothetical protein
MDHVCNTMANAPAHNPKEHPAHIHNRAGRNGSSVRNSEYNPLPSHPLVFGLLLSIRITVHALSGRRGGRWGRFCLGRTRSRYWLRRGGCPTRWSRLETNSKATSQWIVGEKSPLHSLTLGNGSLECNRLITTVSHFSYLAPPYSPFESHSGCNHRWCIKSEISRTRSRPIPIRCSTASG